MLFISLHKYSNFKKRKKEKREREKKKNEKERENIYLNSFWAKQDCELSEYL